MNSSMSLGSAKIGEPSLYTKKSDHISLKSGKSLSIFIKIFINYAQMVSIIHSLELKWPYYVTTYMKVTGNIGTISSEFLSLDCLITDYNIDLNPIYLKALINVVIYVIFLGGAVIFFILIQIISKKRRKINNLIILTIVLSIMIQPNSIKETSDMFNCKEIEGQSYLIKQMSIPCYTSNHSDWVFL